MPKHTKSERKKFRVRDPFKNLFTPQERLRLGLSVPEQFPQRGGNAPGTRDKMNRRISLKSIRTRTRVIRRPLPKVKEQGV
jgi:hypothetical protein